MLRNTQSKKSVKFIVLFSWILIQSSLCQAKLPELGNQENLILSSTQENIIGEAWMQQIRAAGMASQDVLLNDYLRHLGQSLTAHTPGHSNPSYTFFWLGLPEQNAFTFFGGHVGVHYGMILGVKQESELAAVIAHELAHIAQHHLLRQLGEQRKLLPLTIAEAVAAVALGSPILAIAALAGHDQQMINFTRAHEKEADRIGIQILAKAGYDPHSMAEVFERMNKKMRFHDTPAEYLMTHPLFKSRISDSKDRAAQYPYHQKPDSPWFPYIKARVEVLSHPDLPELLKQYQQQLENHRYSDRSAIEYGQALALSKQGKKKEAWTQLSRLATEHTDNLLIQMAIAELEAHSKPSQALKRLKPFLSIYSDYHALWLQYAETLLLAGDSQAARQVLIGHLPELSEEPKAYDLLGQAESKAGHRPLALAAQAEWHVLYGDLLTAIQQLELAVQESGKQPGLKDKLDQRKKQIESLIELRRRL